MLNSSWSRFAAVGIANTILGLVLIYAFKFAMGLGDAAANFAGYAIGMVVGFLLNRRWTFSHQGNAYAAFARYLGVLGCAYVANLAMVLGLIGLLTLDSYLAQALGILPYAAITYAGARYIAFPSQRQALRSAGTGPSTAVEAH